MTKMSGNLHLNSASMDPPVMEISHRVWKVLLGAGEGGGGSRNKKMTPEALEVIGSLGPLPKKGGRTGGLTFRSK